MKQGRYDYRRAHDGTGADIEISPECAVADERRKRVRPLAEVTTDRALIDGLCIMRHVARALFASRIESMSHANFKACRTFGKQRGARIVRNMAAFLSALESESANAPDLLQFPCRFITPFEQTVLDFWTAIIDSYPCAFAHHLERLAGGREAKETIAYGARVALELNRPAGNPSCLNSLKKTALN